MNPFENRFQHALRDQDDDERILPLINVVFLLLIFFMIAGSFTQASPLAIDPAVSDAAEASQGKAPLVYMDADGEIAIGEQRTSLERFAGTWRSAAGGRSYDVVRVHADGKVDSARLVAVMEQLRAAGVDKIRLLTVKRSA